MPVEIEVPTEHLHEAIHEAHHASQGHGEPGHAAGHGGGFTMGVALSSALLAVLAAMAALFAGHFANDAMIERIEAGDQWAYYQAKGIKANVLRSKMATLLALGKEADPKDVVKANAYDEEQEKIQETAFEKTDESENHLTQHTRLAGSVTFFQIAIALGAIAVLTRKKMLWYASLLVGIAGTGTMGWGFTPPPRTEHALTKHGSHAGAEAAKPEAEPNPPAPHE